ncbi:MAG: tRNA lysidine(34) synthetase TilS [Anaerolineales bacterium]
MREIFEQQCGLNKTDPVLVAVSGGPDSLALLHLLRGLGYPLICATFNHRLRPEAADEAAHVRQVAERLGVPFVTDSADVAAYAGAEGLSIEEAARTLRYRFLFRAAREAGAQAVAAGHTADDQAETVLMHFLRGAGLAGLKGMAARVVLPVFDSEIPLVRPLLAWQRADTEAYCRENGLVPLYDPSNADTTYFRNRLRHELLPALESYNPRIRQTLVRAALALQGDEALLAEVIEAAWQKSVLEQGTGFVAFERAALESASPALRRNLFKQAAFSLRPGLRDVDFAALERAAALRPSDLAGGLRLFVEGAKIYLAAYEADLPSSDWPQVGEQCSVFSFQCSVFSHQSSVFSEQCSLGEGWILTCESVSLNTPWRGQAEHRTLNTEHWTLNTDPWSAWLDADVTGDKLRVRAARAGERFQPLGMSGASVKLQDFFVNVKLPRRARKNWPLACVDDEIAWVVGLRLAHPFRVTEKTKRALHLQVKRVPSQSSVVE